MDKESVAVIIVTRSADEELDRCLASLARQTRPPDEVAVFINGDRESVHRLDKWKNSLPLILIVLEKNEGFAAPHTRAIGFLKSDWVAVLNSDAVAEADWLERMLEASRDGADVGMVASAILMGADPEKLESLGLEATRGGFAYLRKWNEPWSDEPTHEVFGPSGGAGMYRKAMLDEVGFFEPEFFIYYEDVDVAWKGRRSGWRCIAAPRARAHHMGRPGAGGLDKTFLLHRNRLLVIAMDWTWRMIFGNIHHVVLWDTLSVLKALREGKIKSAVRARWKLLMFLPWAASKRRALKNKLANVETWLKPDKPLAKARGLLK